MREILFRGKRVDNREWVEGCYIKGVKSAFGKSFILPENINQSGCHHLDGFTVIPESVGQFTGLTDKDGKRIFEGDVLNCIDGNESCNTVIYWDENMSQFSDKRDFDGDSFRDLNGEMLWVSDFEIIGNIHDTPA